MRLRLQVCCSLPAVSGNDHFDGAGPVLSAGLHSPVDTPDVAKPAESATVCTPRTATDPADELNALSVTCPSVTECMEQAVTGVAPIGVTLRCPLPHTRR